MNLEDKVVLVTGSSGGLGAQICYEAAKQGAIVLSCARLLPSPFHIIRPRFQDC